MAETDPRIQALLAQTDWHEERKALRAIVLECGLVEEVKWGKLCYTHDGANVAIFFGLKAYCGLGFFKGALLNDPENILFQQTRNSRAVRLIRFTDIDQIAPMKATVMAYVRNAIEVEKAGLKVDFEGSDALEYPDELQEALESDPELKQAFEALTPGRQRGYVLHFSGARQSATRVSRIEKSRERIFSGKGLNDR